MIPQHEQERIRREAEKKYKKPKDFQRKTYIEASVIEWERKAYEAGASAEYLRHKPLVEALESIKEDLEDILETDQKNAAVACALKTTSETLQQLNHQK